MGGLIVGAGGGSGIFLYNLSKGLVTNRNDYIWGALFGVIAFFGVHLGMYITTHVTSDMDIKYALSGDHISNYEIDGERITFLKYLDLGLESATNVVSVHNSEFEYETGRTVNTIEFVLQVLVSLIGGAAVSFVIFENKRLCERCKKYSKEKELFQFNIGDYDKVAEELNESIKNPEVFRQVIKKFKLTEKNPDTYGFVTTTYCPNCFDNTVTVGVIGRKSKGGEYEVIPEHDQTIKLDPHAIKLNV